jgi:hypothetical protein
MIPPADDPHMWELLRHVLCQVEADTQSPGMTRSTLREQWRRFVRYGGVPWLREHFPHFAGNSPTGHVPAEGSRPERKADA